MVEDNQNIEDIVSSTSWEMNAPSGDGIVQSAQSELVNNLQSKTPANQPSIEDIISYVGDDLSPEDQQALAQEQFYRKNPAAGPLPNEAYYPGMNQPIAVGGYSGSKIGSTTLFAPSGAYMPYGVVAAREKAIQDAALKRAQAAGQFAPKAPTTDHAVVQQKLQERFYEDLYKKIVPYMKKKYGSSWAQHSKDDPVLNQYMSGMNTLAKQHDFLFNTVAKLEDQRKSGTFVFTPDLEKRVNEFYTNMDGLMQGPFNPQGLKFSETAAALNAEYELNKVLNEAVKEIITEAKQKYPGISDKQAYDLIVSKKEEFVSPERIAKMTDVIKDNFYPTSTYNTKDKIRSGLEAILGKGKTTLDISHAAKPKPSSGNEFVYDAKNDRGEAKTNVFISRGGAAQPREGSLSSDYSYKHKKVISTFLPNSPVVYINDQKNGLIPTKEVKPNQEVLLGRTGIYKVYNGSDKKLLGTPLDDQQIKDGIPFKYAVLTEGKIGEGKVTSKVTTPDGEEETVSFKEEKTFFVPVEQVKNDLVSGYEGGKVKTGIPIDEMQAEVERRNANLDAPKQKPPDASSVTEKPKKRTLYTR